MHIFCMIDTQLLIKQSPQLTPTELNNYDQSITCIFFPATAIS